MRTTKILPFCGLGTPASRALSGSRLARLNNDGTVVTGDLLDGYHTSKPYLRKDGALFFARNGLLIAAVDLRIDYRIRLSPFDLDGKFFHTRVVRGQKGAFTTYSTNRIPARMASENLKHVSGLVRMAI